MQKQNQQKDIYCEKSPPNIFAIETFVGLNINHAGIVTIRNPLDTITSLMKRNISLTSASAIWICEAKLISHLQKIDSIYINKYEDLITNTDDNLNKLLKWIGVQGSAKELIRKIGRKKLSPRRSTNKRECIETWNYSPFEGIKKDGILASIRILSIEQRLAIRCFKLKKTYMKIYNSKNETMSEVANYFGYDYKNYFVTGEKITFRKAFKAYFYILSLKINLIKNKPQDLHKKSITISMKIALRVIAESLIHGV
jgi:hypothetical protein